MPERGDGSVCIAVPVDLLRELIKLAVEDADIYDERVWQIIDAARALLRADGS